MNPSRVLPAIDPLVHEPARLRILIVLAMVESADFMFLLTQAELTRGNLSTQLTRLEDAGYVVSAKRVVQNRLRTGYRLSTAGTAALRLYRTTMLDLLSAIPR